MIAALSMRAKTAFLFDLDGTLVDSASLHERAFRLTLEAHAPHLLAGFDYSRWMGRPTRDVFRAAGVEDQLLEPVTSDKQRRYRDFVRGGELLLKPGARDVLESLRGKGKSQWLVTGGSRQAVEDVVRHTGIDGFFQGAVTADDAGRGKPSPDPYLACLKRFGLSADASVAVEDSADGVVSGERAGLDVIQVGSALLRVRPWCSFPGLLELGRFLTEELS
jgi:HAD superfamily hydrolase (TIGR01509 family)